MTATGTHRRRMRGKRVARKAILRPIYLSESASRALWSRATRFPRILGIWTDRLLPSEALAWGRLTRESDDWHDKARRWCIANIDATPTRPCPAYTRLDNLLAGDGKIEADAWVPQQLDGWWRG